MAPNDCESNPPTHGPGGPGVPAGPAPGIFATTGWTTVLRARNPSDAAGRAALEQLCRTYWRPLRAFAIRSGFAWEDAEDFTQDFFVRLLERNDLARVAPEKGRFRNFLLVSFRNFLADQRDKARAAKRGGGRREAWLGPKETRDAPNQVELAGLSGPPTTPEEEFDRQWACALLQRARQRLRDECAATGRLSVYEALGPEDSAEAPESSRVEERNGGSNGYEMIGERLGLSVAAVKSAAFRLRQRYRELIRAEAAETVDSPADVEAELRHLLRILER